MPEIVFSPTVYGLLGSEVQGLQPINAAQDIVQDPEYPASPIG